METKINKQKVQRLLVNLQDLDTKEVTKENGNLDVEKFNNLPEVKELVSKFKEMGVTRVWLRKHFRIAWWLLTF